MISESGMTHLVKNCTNLGKEIYRDRFDQMARASKKL